MPHPARTFHPARTALISSFVLLLQSVDAQSAIHYSEVQDLVIPADIDGIYINPFSDVTSYSYPSDYESQPWVNLLFSGMVIGSSGAFEPIITDPATGNGDGLILAQDFLNNIGSGLDFADGPNGSENHMGSAPGQFQDGEEAYLGFRFKTTPSELYRYGWIRITLNSVEPSVIHDWAWEGTFEQAIEAGSFTSVPEPSMFLLIAVGAGGLLFRRRLE